MDREVLLSIYRHWLWADRMRELFEFCLRRDLPPSVDEFKFDESFFVSNMATCMCLWYGLLFAACDGLEEAGGISITSLDPDYSRVRDLLRRFRNAVFHVQPEYWSEKLMAVLREEELATAVRVLHGAVGKWLQLQVQVGQQATAAAAEEQASGRT